MCLSFSSSVPIHSSASSHSSVWSSFHLAWPGNRGIPEADLSLVQNSLCNSSAELTQVWTKSSDCLTEFIKLRDPSAPPAPLCSDWDTSWPLWAIQKVTGLFMPCHFLDIPALETLPRRTFTSCPLLIYPINDFLRPPWLKKSTFLIV